MDSSRLALGAAQFGLHYGVANVSGQISSDGIAAILDYAGECGINTIDTAIAYGNSEAMLGSAGVKRWRVISKLPGLPNDCADIASWVERSVLGSITRLGVEQLETVLLHRPAQLLGPHGRALYDSLQGLKRRQLVAKIGVSIYGPDELSQLLELFALDVVQAPLNVIDRRLLQGGWPQKLKAAGTELHVRSVFMQGLLLMAPERRPEYFSQWRELWKRWDSWVERHELTALEACLGFVKSVPDIARVIVGVDSLGHLEQIISAWSQGRCDVPDDLYSDDPSLVNPSLWKGVS